MVWQKKRKGCAVIYTHSDVPHAIVDRQGYGIASVTGARITYRGMSFENLAKAKSFALSCQSTDKESEE